MIKKLHLKKKMSRLSFLLVVFAAILSTVTWAQMIDDCRFKGCENNGQCMLFLSSYMCLCPAGYHGQYCQLTAYNDETIVSRASQMSREIQVVAYVKYVVTFFTSQNQIHSTLINRPIQYN